MSEKNLPTNVETQFEALLDEYGRFLRNTIARFCPKNLSAQINDIEQEAKIRLWRAVQSERDLSNPSFYIYRIAMTTTIDAVRKAQARHEEQLRLEEEGSDSVAVLALPTDPEQSPERAAQQKEFNAIIESALAKLVENRRIAVEFHLQGMTSQEIADLMDWTEAKARNLIYRGLEDLRKQLRATRIDYQR
jgi:RNA polymerase sigma-70 factor (ECF subfamily)